MPGCSSTAQRVSGRYVNPQTGGFIDFRTDGTFYYSFQSPSPPLRNGEPTNMGRYYFHGTNVLKPYISVRSAHAVQFAFRFSESKETVYLNCPAITSSEIAFERVP
jgi:hypothetical protein